MSDHTEAAQLLRSGATFSRRAGLRLPPDQLIFAGIKHGGFAVYYDDSPYFHTDLDGRWQRVYRQELDTHFIKSLDGTVHAIERSRADGTLVLDRRRVPFDEAAQLDEWVRASAINLIDSITSSRAAVEQPPGAALEVKDLVDLLERVASWDAHAWFRNREAYIAAYGRARPQPFLSPVCAQPIVLDATRETGTSFDWLFGEFEKPVEALPASEFREHCERVRSLWSRRAAQSHGVVLAGPRALEHDTPIVTDWFKTVREVFGDIAPSHTHRGNAPQADPETPHLAGVYAFLAKVVQRDDAYWSHLSAIGLRHVDLGLVSGSTNVDNLHHTLTDLDRFPSFIGGLKRANLTVGIIWVPGCGGIEHAASHVESSANLIKQLPLGLGDLVYLVDLDSAHAARFEEALLANQMRPVPALDRRAQLDAMRRALADLKSQRGVKVVPYSLAKQAL